ncbi:putative entry exclusion protein TrbK-alt [Acidomonas methanolica]|uniref:putative entry exclusion protein TrbK-alt n=1 Tax=Acidomonas methanolica TaxID=437 RepID=UPI00211A3DAD|nr:putative entry exclusion protein TrbK-alt [Acidomonas methanolica]MCQ9156274.1 putative entry exclusion protein TrbK-alt [Acidomonas methanolica]
MDGKLLARIGAIVFVAIAIAIAIAITATAIQMTRKEDVPAEAPARLIQPDSAPLRQGQRRCQQLGQKVADDAECLRVWAETRDRFLGRTRAPAAPAAPEGR